MQNDLAAAVESLRDDLSAMGEDVLYKSGDATVRPPAVRCQPDELVDAATGEVRIAHDDQDFLIAASDLILGGGLHEPIRGDRITTDDGLTYEAYPRDGKRVYETRGPGRLIYLIHTKRISD